MLDTAPYSLGFDAVEHVLGEMDGPLTRQRSSAS